jgi:putative transposase
MKYFRSPRSAPKFLTAFSQISPHFRPRRHLMTAPENRAEMTRRITGTTTLPTAA